MIHIAVWKLFLYCTMKEARKDLFCFIFKPNASIMTDPWVYATFDHYLKNHSEGHAVKI